MNFFVRVFLKWMPLGVGITLVCGFIYVTVQQNYRQSLNDPQIQLAEDSAAALEGGASAASVVPSAKIDIAQSLAPWVAVYNASGTPIASSGELNGAMPQLPDGVFDAAQWSALIIGHLLNTQPTNEDRFSWQPQSDVRQAVVLVHASNGMFVASGRNMREVEDREAQLENIVGLGWIVTMVITFLAQTLAQYLL